MKILHGSNRTLFRINGSSPAFQIGTTLASADLNGTAHFLNAPMQVVDASTILIEVAAEQFNPADSLTSITLEKVDGDNGAESVLSAVSMVRGIARTYPGNTAQTNSVAPWAATVSLDEGENIFRISYNGARSTASKVYHHVYRKTLSSTTVSTKSNLVAAIKTAVQSSIGGGHDIINVSAPLSFEWNEYSSLAVGGLPSPASIARDYPVIIQPSEGGSLTFKMDYHAVYARDGIGSVTDANPGTFASEQFSSAMYHFKNVTFGVQNQPMSSALYWSDNLLNSGRRQVATFENCTFYDSGSRGLDATRDTSPSTSDAIRNRYEDSIKMDYPYLSSYAPGPAPATGTGTIARTGPTTSIDCTGLSNIFSQSYAPAIRSIESEDLGSGAYEIRLVFTFDEDVTIFSALTDWLAEHSYGSGSVDAFTIDGTGWTSAAMLAGSPGALNAFRSDIVSTTSQTIALRGTVANSVGAALAALSIGASCDIVAPRRSAQFKSSLCRSYDADSSGVARQRVSMIGCTFDGLVAQGGAVTFAERIVDCYYKHSRGDFGHNPLCGFNCAFESGTYILTSDFFDISHADILQIFGPQPMSGRILQNVFKGSDGIFGGDDTIQWIFDRSGMSGTNTHRGIILDSWIEDPNVYFDENGGLLFEPETACTTGATLEDVRISGMSIPTAKIYFRFDFTGDGTLDMTDASVYFHNNEFKSVSFFALAGGSGAESTTLQYGRGFDSPPSGAETNIGLALNEASEVGTGRLGSIWTGTNTVLS
jgi:hypothetical protein